MVKCYIQKCFSFIQVWQSCRSVRISDASHDVQLPASAQHVASPQSKQTVLWLDDGQRSSCHALVRYSKSCHSCILHHTQSSVLDSCDWSKSNFQSYSHGTSSSNTHLLFALNILPHLFVFFSASLSSCFRSFRRQTSYFRLVSSLPSASCTFQAWASRFSSHLASSRSSSDSSLLLKINIRLLLLHSLLSFLCLRSLRFVLYAAVVSLVVVHACKTVMRNYDWWVYEISQS